MNKYRQGPGSVFEKGSRKVLIWENDGVGTEAHFRCPCGQRSVYVTSPPHTVTVDDDGLVTLDGSVGMRRDDARGDGVANWCHFWLKSGIPEMCGDSRCPGRGAA